MKIKSKLKTENNSDGRFMSGNLSEGCSLTGGRRLFIRGI